MKPYRFMAGLRQVGRMVTDSAWWEQGGIRIGLNWPLFIGPGALILAPLGYYQALPAGGVHILPLACPADKRKAAKSVAYRSAPGPGVEVIARCDGHIVGVRQGRMMGVPFHPELSDDARLHEYFLEMVRAARGSA